MGSPWLHPNVKFMAGRPFTHDGDDYLPGDMVEPAKGWRNLESAIRSRHLIPVVDDIGDVPAYMQKEVKTVDFAHQKMGWVRSEGKESEEISSSLEGEKILNPDIHTANEIYAYLNEHPEQTEDMLRIERNGKNRVTVVAALEKRLESSHG